MASKGQKFNSYSSQLKKQILDTYFSGNGTTLSLSKDFNIPEKTIKNWISKYKKGLDVTVDHRAINSGRRKDEDIDYKERYEILKNYQAFLKAQREKK